jgi:hypothetical protein
MLLEIDSKLSRPRDQLSTREDPRFLEYRHEIYAKIRDTVAEARER